MAYGILYTLTWESLFGESETLEIQDRDLGSDSNTTFVLEGNPISIEYDTPNDFVFHPINGSRAKLRLVTQTNFQFDEFRTSDATKYKVLFKIGSAVKWQGFIMSQYETIGRYTAAPSPITFMASDRLGILKRFNWDKTATVTELQVLGYIFEKTEMKFNMQESINVYENNHNNTAADSPLDQTYFDMNVFEGKTYYDVLYHILFKYSAILRQRNGEWFIYRLQECNYLYNLRKWTLSGNAFTYDSYQGYNPMKAITAADVGFDDLVRIADQASYFERPGWKKYKLTHTLGIKEAFNKNYDFSNWLGNDPLDWDHGGTITYYRYLGLKIFANSSLSSSNYFRSHTSFSGDTTVTQGIRISLDIDVGVPGNTDITMYFLVRLNINTFYDIDTNTWTTPTPSRVQKKITNNEAEFMIQNEKVEFITAHLPLYAVNDFSFYILAPVCSSALAYIKIKEAKCSLIQFSGGRATEFDEEVEYNITIDSNNSYEPDDMEILLADIPVTVPPSYNCKNIWNGILYEDATRITPTSSWNADGRVGTLVKLMEYVFDDFFQDTQRVIIGHVYSKLIDPCTIIIETNDDNRPYMIKRATWHPKLNRWDVEMFELPFEIDLGSSGAPESPGKEFILLESESGALLLESESEGIEKE